MKAFCGEAAIVYVALIRAVNVGGTGVLRMSELRKRFEALGFKDVETYIQSGNVVFVTTDADRGRVTRKIEADLSAVWQRPAKVFLLTLDELKKAAAGNPFDPERLDKEQRCHLMFLSGVPEAGRRRDLMAMRGEEYRFHIQDRVLYYAYSRKDDGHRRTIDFEKVLGVSGTSRTWKVVSALIAIMSSRTEDAG